MSQWGNLDRLVLTGKFNINNGEANVTGDANVHLIGNVEAGDSIVIANLNYRVNTVDSDNTFTMDVTFNGSVTNGTFAVQKSPKDLFTIGNGANTQNKRNVYGVDKFEVPANKAKGFNQPGWTNYITYTDAHGQVRHKAEPLVAMSKNFNVAGTATDANDDAVVFDYTLSFTAQPTDQSAAAGNAISFVTVATSSPAGATLGYQWYENGTALSDGGDYSGTDSNTLAIAEVANVNANVYFVDVYVVGGNGANVRSASATATDTTA